MISKSKIDKLAAFSFLNGVRLHEDSILLFKKGSLPSAFQLSILAQEEIGKAFVFDDMVLEQFDKLDDYDQETKRFKIVKGLSDEGRQIIEWVLSSHQMKQGWFSREAGDEVKTYKGKIKISKFIEEINSGKLEIKKQNSTYVGLKRIDRGKFDLDGKVVDPESFVKVKEVEKHITRVNDFVIEFIEKCRRDISSVDSDWFDECLNLDLVKELEKKWPLKNRNAFAILKKIRKNPIGS